MEPAEEEAYELVMHVNVRIEGTSHLNHDFPGITQYRTRDLFRPHPTKPNLWRFHGRRDDIIVLSNGEKFNPVPMEIMVQGDPRVLAALVIDQGRFQAALLIKANSKVPDNATLKSSIWPLVEEDNSKLPSQGRISHSKILIADSNKPFQRAGKGTVVRKQTEKDFAFEIDDLYNANDQGTQSIDPILETSFNYESVKRFLRALVAGMFPVVMIRELDNMYVLGLDSLKTIEIANLLQASLRNQVVYGDLSWLSNNTIYAIPSINQLTVILADYLNSGLIHPKNDYPKRNEKISALVERYTTSLAQRALVQKKLRAAAEVIALTDPREHLAPISFKR